MHKIENEEGNSWSADDLSNAEDKQDKNEKENKDCDIEKVYVDTLDAATQESINKNKNIANINLVGIKMITREVLHNDAQKLNYQVFYYSLDLINLKNEECSRHKQCN